MVKFTIVTVAKNAAASLGRCIESVARQRYPQVEYIIIDGASTDSTPSVIESHRGAVTRYISEPDTGIYNAMNKGLAMARGDFIFFLGADDYLVDPGVLEDVAAFLAAHPDCDYAYGGISIRLPDGREQPYMPPPPEQALEFLVCGCLPHQASFASRRAFDLAGAFNEQYRIAGDYDWFLRVITHPEVVTRRFDRIVASYHADGRSNDLARSQPEVYVIQNSFPAYQTPEWRQRRLHIFQEELLRRRIECNELQDALQQIRSRPLLYAAGRAFGRKAGRLVERALATPPRELPRRLSRYLQYRMRRMPP